MSCTCVKDPQITCIVHPTELSLKQHIAELKTENLQLMLRMERAVDIMHHGKTWHGRQELLEILSK